MNTSFINTFIADQWIKFQNVMSALMYLKTLPGIYLTGSRFFGTENGLSDYDFFISIDDLDHKHVLDLSRLGFERAWETEYDGDPTVLMVYAFHGNIDIHLQVISSAW